MGGSTGVTDGVTGVGIVGAGDGGVDGVGVQPNISANINADMTKKFHFIPTSQPWLGIYAALATKQPYYALKILCLQVNFG